MPASEEKRTAAWRAKRELILALLDEPRTLEMLQIHFPSYERTKQYMTNLVQRKKIPPPLPVLWNDNGGRPRNVYCRRFIPHKLLKHEITATMVADAFRSGGATVTRRDIPLSSDRFMRIDGDSYYIEVDMGTETGDQLAKVLSKYEGQSGFVLFATVTKDQMVLAKSQTKLSHVYFSLIETVLEDPFGRHWVNRDGKVGGVPEPSIERQ